MSLFISVEEQKIIGVDDHWRPRISKRRAFAARWSDKLRKVAGSKSVREMKNRGMRRSLGNTYVRIGQTLVRQKMCLIVYANLNQTT